MSNSFIDEYSNVAVDATNSMHKVHYFTALQTTPKQPEVSIRPRPFPARCLHHLCERLTSRLFLNFQLLTCCSPACGIPLRSHVYRVLCAATIWRISHIFATVDRRRGVSLVNSFFKLLKLTHISHCPSTGSSLW